MPAHNTVRFLYLAQPSSINFGKSAARQHTFEHTTLHLTALASYPAVNLVCKGKKIRVIERWHTVLVYVYIEKHATVLFDASLIKIN
jgi:hypothetical protein